MIIYFGPVEWSSGLPAEGVVDCRQKQKYKTAAVFFFFFGLTEQTYILNRNSISKKSIQN